MSTKQPVPDGIFLLRVSGAMSILMGITFAILIGSRFDEFSALNVIGAAIPSGMFIAIGAVAFIPSPTRTNKWALAHVVGSIFFCVLAIPAGITLAYWNEIWSDEWPEVGDPVVGSRRNVLAGFQVFATLVAIAFFVLMTFTAESNRPSNRVVADDGTPQVVQKLEDDRSSVDPAKGPYDTWAYRPGGVWFASQDRGEPLITVEVGTACNWRCEPDIADAVELGKETGTKVVVIVEDCPDEEIGQFLTDFATDYGEADYWCQDWQIDEMWQYLPAIRIFDSTGRLRYVSDATWPSNSTLAEVIEAAEESAEIAPPIIPEQWLGEWCLKELQEPNIEAIDPGEFAQLLREFYQRKSTRIVVSNDGVSLRAHDGMLPTNVTHASQYAVYAQPGESAPEPFNNIFILREFDDGMSVITNDGEFMRYHDITKDLSQCTESYPADAPLKFDPTTPQGAPEWTQNPPGEWPQIVLTNEFGRSTDGYTIPNASSFLVRDGSITAVALARHLIEKPGGFDPKLEPADIEKAPIAWKAHPRTDPDKFVEAKKVLTTYPFGPVNALALEVSDPSATLPATPLEIRAELPQLGESVVLLACAYEDVDCKQAAVRGVVVERVNDLQPFTIVLENPVHATGMSGAPVVDWSGRAVGIFTNASRWDGTTQVVYVTPAVNLLR